MTTIENPDAEHQPVSRRGFAKAAVAALAVAGFGGAALNGVLAGQGDDAEAVSAERRRRCSRGSGGSGGSGGRRRRCRHRRRGAARVVAGGSARWRRQLGVLWRFNPLTRTSRWSLPRVGERTALPPGHQAARDWEAGPVRHWTAKRLVTCRVARCGHPARAHRARAGPFPPPADDPGCLCLRRALLRLHRRQVRRR